ncbi:kinase-like domain-containing protein [Xylariales sp. AK1849]|nr:kinase-like domain-containing protein [Xylariales sp. AK1849]
MSSEADWKTSLSSLARYENIQQIKAAIESSQDPSNTFAQQDAFTMENEAYKASMSLDEYNAACQARCVKATDASASEVAISDGDSVTDSRAISIGSYHNCDYVASGVTAEVYRSQARALKVITETRCLEPHDPHREARILVSLKKPCIPLLETFRDQAQRFVLVFPYMPLSLDTLLTQGSISPTQVKRHFKDLFSALQHIHEKGIIHRDVKPSALLLETPNGPAYLSDFGTAWQTDMSRITEPPDHKILDVGTGPYRAPEVLFGNRSYGSGVDMWGAGVMLAECCRQSPGSLFESRPVHEDGNQLGLILSIFKTMGSPTRETWPEATSFRTPPFDMYQAFESRAWKDILPDVRPDFRDLIVAVVRYSDRANATQALEHLTSIQVSD